MEHAEEEREREEFRSNVNFLSFHTGDRVYLSMWGSAGGREVRVSFQVDSMSFKVSLSSDVESVREEWERDQMVC